ADQRVTWHVQHITQPAPTQSGPKRGATPKFVIARHPATGQLHAAAVQQGQADPPPLLERHDRRHVRLPAACLVLRPFLWQIQLPIHQALACRCHVSQDPAHLAVLDFAQTTAPLPGHAAGVGSGTVPAQSCTPTVSLPLPTTWSCYAASVVFSTTPSLTSSSVLAVA